MPASRCPACRAALPVDADWCSLCYADLRPAAVAVPAGQAVAPSPVEPQPRPGQVSPHPLSTSAGGVRPEPRWPCAECGATVPMDLSACPACGRDFLAGLHEDGVTGVSALDRLAGFATGNRLAALGIGLATCGLFLLLWFVLGVLT